MLAAAILAGLCCAAAMVADLSTVGQWTNKYPFDKIAGGKSLWDQPGVQAAMRAAMGKRFDRFSEMARCDVIRCDSVIRNLGFSTREPEPDHARRCR